MNSNPSTDTIFIERNMNETVSVLIMMKADIVLIQPAITCSKLTIETLGQGMKYVQS